MRLPHIANFADAAPFQVEPDVAVTYIDRPEEAEGADVVIVPGTDNTMAALRWLRASGLAEAIIRHSQAKGATVGLCGGYQLLGQRLEEAAGAEDHPVVCEGLGLLPVVTRLAPGKPTVAVEVEGLTGMVGTWAKGLRLEGAEIHSGETARLPGGRPAFHIVSRAGVPTDETDGCIERGGWTFGTSLYGLFHNDPFRRRFLNALRARRGLLPLALRR